MKAAFAEVGTMILGLAVLAGAIVLTVLLELLMLGVYDLLHQ